MGELALQIGDAMKWLALVFLPSLALPLLVLAIGKPVSRLCDRVSGLLDSVSSGALWLARVSALILVLAQLAVILGRYVFGWSASWLNEMVVYGFAALFMLAASSALKADAHVRVDIFRGNMRGKQKAIVDLAGLYVFLIPVCALILWTVSGSSSFAESWLNLEGSRESDGLPIYFLFRTLIPVFAVLMLLQGASEAMKNAQIVRGLRAPDEPHEFEHGAA